MELRNLNIAVIGTGYVGITTAATLGEFGHQVIAVDINDYKIEQLKKGELPIYEPNMFIIIWGMQVTSTYLYLISLSFLPTPQY